MADTLLKALAYDNEVRVYVVNATNSVEEARTRHQSWHTATAVLGRTLIATSLLAGNLKGNDTLSVEIKGTGPVGTIRADGAPNGDIRGFVSNPKVALELNEAGKIDVKKAVGLPGTLTVSKHMQDSEPFRGQVELISGELGEDFTYYMAVSEQTPSAIGVSVLVDTDDSVKAAGGFMIQVLPDASEDTIHALEKKLSSLGRVSDLIEQGIMVEELLATLVEKDNYNILDEYPIQFHCQCSHEHFEEQLSRLSSEDLQLLIEEDHGAEIICHYCNSAYQYTESQLQNILDHKIS